MCFLAHRQDTKNLASIELFMETSLFPKPTEVMTSNELKKYCQSDSRKQLCIVFMKGSNYVSSSRDDIHSVERRFEAEAIKKFPKVNFVQIDGTKYRLNVESEDKSRDFDFELFAIRQNFLYSKMDYSVKSIENDVDGYALTVANEFISKHVQDSEMTQVKGASSLQISLVPFSGMSDEVKSNFCSGKKVAQLKEYLASKRASCDGCAEKSDFVKKCEEVY
jgi:hypothetical protein